MSVPLPALYCPTPESRLAAMLALRREGIHWGWIGHPDELDYDIKRMKRNEETGIEYPENISPYWVLEVGNVRSMDGHYTLKPGLFTTNIQPKGSTLVNSVSHFLSYVRRHNLYSSQPLANIDQPADDQDEDLA